MKAIDTVRIELEPKLDALLMYLESVHDARAHAFFVSIRDRLLALEEEEQLLELFIQLSMAAFQPFVLDPVAVLLADEVLAYAEQVSDAFSADASTAH
ncbi:MAG: hypothetical protein ACI9WS_003397 [Paraglaciecola psychrophila]|jgi:hypothetical protein